MNGLVDTVNAALDDSSDRQVEKKIWFVLSFLFQSGSVHVHSVWVDSTNSYFLFTTIDVCVCVCVCLDTKVE